MPVNSSEMVESALFCHSLGLPASSDKIKEKGSEILNWVLNNFLKTLIGRKQTNKQTKTIHATVCGKCNLRRSVSITSRQKYPLSSRIQITAPENLFGQLLLLSLEQHAQPSRALWGCMHEERISSLIPFNFYPAFKIGMYEGRLRLSGRPKRVKCYSLIFLRLSRLNAG